MRVKRSLGFARLFRPTYAGGERGEPVLGPPQLLSVADPKCSPTLLNPP